MLLDDKRIAFTNYFFFAGFVEIIGSGIFDVSHMLWYFVNRSELVAQGSGASILANSSP